MEESTALSRLQPGRRRIADATEDLDQDVALDSQLSLIDGMLILASAAAPEYRTGRLNAIGGRLINPEKLCALDMPARFAALRIYCLTGKNKRSENHFAVNPAQALASVHKFFNFELQTNAG